MKSWGRPYFDLYDNILDQYGLPREMKYLSVIESHLNSGLVSWAGDAGEDADREIHRQQAQPRGRALAQAGSREQKTRYRKIVAEQDALAPKRERWVAAFLERIQTRGFNVHSNMLRKIPQEEIPQKPRRKFKVVF